MSRIDGRAGDQLRPVEIIPNINRFAEGSCLIRCGNTHVLCTAGRSAEIQRLIGRALRAVVDRKKLGPWNVTIDCDVLQGDGGTRTASITGGYVAMVLAFQKMQKAGQLNDWPVSGMVAAVSAGVVDDVPMLDLCYEEDSSAMVDLNCVMDDQGRLIEIQGTGEGRPFTLEEQQKLVALCSKGIQELQAIQRRVLEQA